METYNKIDFLSDELLRSNNSVWIYPAGSISDFFVLNSVLHRFYENNNNYKFNLVSRSVSDSIFDLNPIINERGQPPKGATILRTNYWDRDEFKLGIINSFDMLSKIFLLPIQSHKKIIYDYKNNIIRTDILNLIPANSKKIIIAPFFEGNFDAFHPLIWQNIVEKLLKANYTIIQIGDIRDEYIKGTYSLLGVLNYSEIAELISKADMIITSDNFIKELCSINEKLTIVLAGPQNRHIPNYINQILIIPEIISENQCIDCVFKEYFYDKNVCRYAFDDKCSNILVQDKIIEIINSKL